MDPLSVTCSVLTLIATLDTAKKYVQKLRRSLGAVALVTELLDETSDLQALLVSVEAYSELDIFTPKAQAALERSLSRTSNACDAFLEFVVNKLFSKKEGSPGPNEKEAHSAGTSKPSRRAWFIYERDAAKHRDSLRQARESLHFALTVANTGIHVNLREAITTSQSLVHTRLVAHGEMVDHLRTLMQELVVHKSDRSRSSSVSSDRTLTPESPSSDFEENMLTPTQSKTSADVSDACRQSCSCSCHTISLVKSPRWTDRITGSLLMRYSGFSPRRSAHCRNQHCREGEQSVHAAYYLPTWMLRRMVEVDARWDAISAPKMNIRVMRVMPDSSPIFTLAMEGNTMGIQELIKQSAASPIDIRETDGRSALHIAIYYGHIKTAQFLLDQNADRDYRDKYFQSAVGACWEIRFQKLPIPAFEPSVIGGALEDSDYLDERALSSVHKIVLGISSVPVTLSDYLSLSAADIDKKDVMGKTPLHYASARGDFLAVTTLLQHGANPNLRTDAQWTPLHEAAISADSRSLRALLDAGADFDARNNRGQTALALAAYVRDDPAYFDALVEYGTDIHVADLVGRTALHRACIRDRVASARRLVALGCDVDALDGEGVAPVHMCVLQSSCGVLRVLLGVGVRVDRVAKNGRTLLHDAAALGNARVLACLLEMREGLDGVDLDVRDAEGRTVEEVYVHERAKVGDAEMEDKAGFALRMLLDSLRERSHIHALAEKLEEKLEVQSTASDDVFFEAMDLMESSVDTLVDIGI